jgi:hypothetical protein
MGGWSAPSSGHFTPGKDTRYPLYRRLGGPQGRFGRVPKISSQQGFDPRTIQSVAGRYTDYTIPAHSSLTKFDAGLLRMELELSIHKPAKIHYLYISQ